MVKPIDEVINIYNKNIRNSINKCIIYTNYLSYNDFEKFLYKIPQMWRRKQKSCRSATTIPIFKILNGGDIPEELEKVLISLDVKINTFDELLDKDSLESDEKAAFVMSNLFSDLNLIKFSMNNDEIIENYQKYLTDIVTIPYIEGRTYKNILETEKIEQEIEESIKSYKYRSKDISIFIKLPDVNLNLDLNEKLKKQIYTYRALELLTKDLIDLEEDISNNETKPITAFVKKYNDNDIINQRISSIKKRLIDSVEWENKNTLIEKYILNLRNNLGGLEIG